MKIAFVLGTRPEIIKMAPLIVECEKRNISHFIVHSNQHYSKELDEIFFDELKLALPHYNLNVGSASHAIQTGKIMIGIEEILSNEKPSVVLVEGDTNTVLAGALTASKLQIKVGHVEAGLRSYYREMPEEINRTLTDHCSDMLFAPTEKSRNILLKEGISEDKIFVTGNTIVDAINRSLQLTHKNEDMFAEMDLVNKDYFLLTLHRQENVDNEQRLQDIMFGINAVIEEFNLPIIFPIHPRTKKMLEEFCVRIPKGVKVINPIGYLDFLLLQSHARLVLTDSGGIQEESCILKIPCVTLRDNTERPETIEVGANILAGSTPPNILSSAREMLNRRADWQNPFGDGRASKRIVDVLFKIKCI